MVSAPRQLPCKCGHFLVLDGVEQGVAERYMYYCSMCGNQQKLAAHEVDGWMKCTAKRRQGNK